MSQTSANNVQNESFNYKITRFFLDNTRLTALALLVLLLVGFYSLFNLKTTGFPSPTIDIVVVQTIYPGASSEVVARDVTRPLETAIKSIEGIKTYSSTTQNSVSILQITIDEKASADNVKNKISTQIASVVLPVNAQKPKILPVNIGGTDYIFSITSGSLDRTYAVAEKLKTDVANFEQTKSITEPNELQKKVIITINQEKLAASGISLESISAKIKSLDESLPVVSGVALDNQNQSITTSIPGKSLEDLKNLSFAPPARALTQNPVLPDNQKFTPPTTYKLTDLATVDVGYRFKEVLLPVIGLEKKDTSPAQTAIILNIKAVDGTDQTKFIKKIEEAIKNQDVVFAKTSDMIAATEKPVVIEHYSVNEDNQEQVSEVIKGLIGGKLAIDDKNLANLGWILGALQLVVLVMIAFVSWRAAIVAAISIPLSLIFSVSYIYLIGENLNTLVLFSLVLVIGLVVDPALVILEAIQRKIDIGLKGRDAVLAAIHDVGNGLFIATLVSAIVFVPFAVISGILGQIFKYIPLTVIPAIIGSYIVPLVFLSWFGSLILKKTKGKTENEQENLWGIAKWLVAFNRKVLHSPVWVRTLIVLLGIIIPISVSAYFFGNRQIKQVQFSSSDNGLLLQISGSYKTNLTTETRDATTRQIITIAMQDPDIISVFPSGRGQNLSYYATLTPTKDRTQNAKQLAKKLSDAIPTTITQNFNDFSVANISQGPPGTSYQVSISIKENDLSVLKTGALGVGDILKKVCSQNGIIKIGPATDCTPIIEKIDDGYTGKENKVLDVVLNRQTLEQNGLTIANAPQTALVNQQIRAAFELSNPTENYGSVAVNGENIAVLFEKQSAIPKTVDVVKTLPILGLTGQITPLDSLATFEVKTPSSSITRIKGETIGLVQAALKQGYTDQQISSQVTDLVVKYFADEAKTKELGLAKNTVTSYSEGGSASFVKSFTDLLLALLLAIIFVYTVLVIFFGSFSLPLVILYTIPLTLMGWVPALATFGGGQFGFLEIIGLIILVGLVCNVAIFLIDAARQKIAQGIDEKEAIALASGLRLRPVLLTKLVAGASLAPLILFAEIYRSLSIVIVFGLLASGFVSLITTPILFIFFRWLSREYRRLAWYNKILFFPFMLIYIPIMGYLYKRRLQVQKNLPLPPTDVPPPTPPTIKPQSNIAALEKPTASLRFG